MREELKSKEEFSNYYIKNFSSGVFKKSLDIYGSKLKKLKTKKGKDDYLYLFYSTYIQLLENFSIFLLVLFNEKGIENIFEKNSKQNENLIKLLHIKNEKGTYIFGNEFNFFIKDIINKYIGTNENEYNKYIKEAIKDYFLYKDLLNSYKHGFRLNSHGKGETYIGSETQQFLIGSYENSILYYTKKENIIYENIYYFNYEYIWLKAEFIINLIDNLKLNQLNIGKKIKRETIYIKDNTIKNKFQTFIGKNAIFEIKNNK